MATASANRVGTLAQDLKQEARIALLVRGLQRAALL
jgi:hypothetical protein